MSSKLKELVKQVQKLEEKMKKDGQDALHSAFKEFFESNPEAKAIVWTQYTPWFNDGDACTFSVHEMELKLHELPDGIDEDEAELITETDYGYGDGCAANSLGSLDDTAENRKWLKERKSEENHLRPLTESEKKLCVDFDELYSSCNEIDEVMRMTFGDHVKVVATKDGFDIDEYEHD